MPQSPDVPPEVRRWTVGQMLNMIEPLVKAAGYSLNNLPPHVIRQLLLHAHGDPRPITRDLIAGLLASE